jgi:prepilin-type N-terminal cleavage/methylation domain-containing protein
MRLRVRHEQARSSDAGFTLIELVVAMMIIGVVLIGLVLLQTSALVTSVQARQRVQATAIGNEVMEELRALPWLTLNKGMSSSFVSAAGGDANVSGVRLRPTVGAPIDEPLVISTDQSTSVAPLSGAGGTNKTVESDPSSASVSYTSRAYVTRSPQTASDVLTLTVITTWKTNTTGKNRFLVLRSEAYAPSGGCGDASNQPFLGACQALLSGDASADGATITVTAGGAAPTDPTVIPTTPILPGSPFTIGTVRAGNAGVGVSSQQSTTVESKILHAAAQLSQADATAPVTTTGGSVTGNSASNDVGSAGAAPANPGDVVGSGAATPLVVSSGPLSLTMTAGAGAGGIAKASTVNSCAGGVPATQPCAFGQLSGGGSTSVTLGVGATQFVVANVAAGGSRSAFGARLTSLAGGSAAGCTVISGAGCVATGATRTVGTTTVGGGAWNGGAASSGLVEVTGYSDGTRVERGLSQRTTPATSTRTATIRIWNGTGYTTANIALLTDQTWTSAPVTWTSGGSSVTASATVTATPGASIAANPDPAGCTAEGCSVAADTGTLTASVTYSVSSAGTTATFIAATSLGGTQASAGFKAAPDA